MVCQTRTSTFNFEQKMPKQRRLYPNENPQKQNAPGHGKVERSKGDMWTTTTTTKNGAPAPSSTTKHLPRKASKYQVTEHPVSTTLGIGRGGAKKKNSKQMKAKVTTTTTGTTEGRSNPDADFFK